jgi:hypothetical protein
MLMPQTVLIMGTRKCSAGISTQYDAYVRACATEELCDKTQTQFYRFMNAHIIIIISHKPSNSIDFLFLTHG